MAKFKNLIRHYTN